MFPSRSNIQGGTMNTGAKDGGRQSLLDIFNALTVLSLGLPEHFDEIPTVNLYAGSEFQGDNWEAVIKDNGPTWIITPLQYSKKSRSRVIRKAPGGGRWDARDLKKNHWFERKYKFVESENKQKATNERMGLRKYTMIEYTPDKPKSTHALCLITADKLNDAHDRQPSSSQQPKSKEIDHTDSNNGDSAPEWPVFPTMTITTPLQEIDHTDSNNGDKGGTSLSNESMKQGGTFENATGYSNQSNLEMFFARVVQGGELSEFMKHFSKDDIVQVFSQKIDEKLAASPKEHSTEAAVMNPRKRSHGTNMKRIMEADVSIQRQKQGKVEILGLKEVSTRTSSGATFEQWNDDPRPDKDTLEGLVWSCSTHHDASYTSEGLVETKCCRLNQQVFEQNRYHLPNYNQDIIAPRSTTSYHANIEPQMFGSNTYEDKPTNLHCDTNRNCLEKNDEQGRNTIYFEQLLSSCNTDDCIKLDDLPLDSQLRYQQLFADVDAVVQEPNQLSHNFNANSTVAMDYQNRPEPYPSTSNFATTEGRLDHQEFEQNVQDPYNFNANLTETMENGWCLPFYYAPTVPPITDQGTCNAIEEHQFALYNTQHGQIFESDAYVLEPNNSSYYFKTISTDPTEKGNHLPIYNQNTIAPSLDTNNNGTTEPKDMDWINITDFSDLLE